MTIFNILGSKFVFSNSITVDYIIVGGGGSASNNGGSTAAGAGGGGGGVKTANNVVVKSGPHIVKVGAGGLWNRIYGLAHGGACYPGDYSQFGDNYAAGGNTGANYQGGASGTADTTIPGLGYPGGSYALANSQGYAPYSSPSLQRTSGGGGGAGGSATGYSLTTDINNNNIGTMNGGVGIYSSITGSNTAYGGGGAGEWSSAGAGGGGGFDAGNGTDGLGGGGGAHDYWWSGTSGGGNGGSGVVIVRVPVWIPRLYTTGSPTVTTFSNYRLYKWTTAGTYEIVF